MDPDEYQQLFLSVLPRLSNSERTVRPPAPPFKNSPATYATCCKQHAATAPAKPAPKPAAKTYPLNYYPTSVAKMIDYTPDTGPVGSFREEQRPPAPQPPQNITTPTNQTGPRDIVHPQYKALQPSGGSGRIFGPEIKCQTGCNKQCGKGGCGSKRSPRLQYGVYNDSPEVDFNVSVTIPQTWTGVDSATLQVGGVAHHGSCQTDGYKAYIGINGGKNGIGTEVGDKQYDDLATNCVGNLQPGQTYVLRMLKRNVGGNVQLNTG